VVEQANPTPASDVGTGEGRQAPGGCVRNRPRQLGLPEAVLYRRPASRPRLLEVAPGRLYRPYPCCWGP
jgi:hypothetical protein